jgi:hypothetical protein
MDIEPVKPKRTYTKKAKAVEDNNAPKPEIVEEIKPKRAYTKKVKAVEENNDSKPEIIEEIKPKKVYIKKTKVVVEDIKEPIIEEFQSSIIEEIKQPIIEEIKPRKIYIKKSKIIENNVNINAINTEIEIIEEKLDKLTIQEENTSQSDIVLNNTVNIENNTVNIENNKRKIEIDTEKEIKKPTLYTYEIDIDLNLYIYDKFHDGKRLNKKSVLQISSFISTQIDDLDKYIVKQFYIKSNNSDIKVCYLGNNFNNNGKYDFQTKLYIDNNIYKNIYEELKFKYIEHQKDMIFFKKYIVEIPYYEVYMNIY